MNKLEKEKYKDDYYIVDEIDIDRKMHTVQILDKLDRKYAISKEIPEILKDNLLKRKEIRDRISRSIWRLLSWWEIICSLISVWNRRIQLNILKDNGLQSLYSDEAMFRLYWSI